MESIDVVVVERSRVEVGGVKVTRSGQNRVVAKKGVDYVSCEDCRQM